MRIFQEVMDVIKFNKKAWNNLVETKNQWTVPVTSEQIRMARNGEWSVLLTPEKFVPKSWFPPMKKLKILALASGGGQQAPLFASAGAEVVVFDNSPNQLEQDTLVASREGLSIQTVEGDMTDLSVFPSEYFDLIFHPCSNMFVPDVNPVWKEAHRVLKTGGHLLAGFCNPVAYTMDAELEKKGIAQMKHKIPYSDITSITEEERVKLYGKSEPINFGHTLDDLLGGQIQAGFAITGFYEDGYKNEPGVHQFLKCFIATKATKLGSPTQKLQTD